MTDDKYKESLKKLAGQYINQDIPEVGFKTNETGMMKSEVTFPRYENYMDKLVEATKEANLKERLESAKAWTPGLKSEPTALDRMLKNAPDEIKSYYHYKPIADQGPVYVRDMENVLSKQLFKTMYPTQYQNIESSRQDGDISELPDMTQYALQFGKDLTGLEPKTATYAQDLKNSRGKSVSGMYFPTDDEIALSYSGLMDYATAPHELMHMANYKKLGGDPQTEERLDVNFNQPGIKTKLDQLSNARHLSNKMETPASMEGVKGVRYPEGYRAEMYNVLQRILKNQEQVK